MRYSTGMRYHNNIIIHLRYHMRLTLSGIADSPRDENDTVDLLLVDATVVPILHAVEVRVDLYETMLPQQDETSQGYPAKSYQSPLPNDLRFPFISIQLLR
jgi:hypothetical protein